MRRKVCFETDWPEEPALHRANLLFSTETGDAWLLDSADAGKDGSLLPSKRFVSKDFEGNRESLDKPAEKLEPQAVSIQFMEFTSSGPLRGIAPVLDFAEKTSAKP